MFKEYIWKIIQEQIRAVTSGKGNWKDEGQEWKGEFFTPPFQFCTI